MNLRNAPVTADGLTIGGLTVPVEREAMGRIRAAGLQTVTAGVRPESLSLVPSGSGGFDVVVELVEELGADALVHASVAGEFEESRLVLRVDGRTPPALGQTVTVALRHPDEMHLFHPETGERLT